MKEAKNKEEKKIIEWNPLSKYQQWTYQQTLKEIG